MAPSIEEAHAEAVQHLASIAPKECCLDALAALCHAVLAEAYEKTDMPGLAVARIKARIDSLGKEGK